MEFSDLAGVGGIGFVTLAIVVNVVYVRAGLPLPGSGGGLREVTDDFAGIGDRLRLPSIVAPATWLLLTLFAAGLVAMLWRAGGPANGWALAGLAGVLMQNVTFTVVEALRFGMATAAAHHRESMAGLWGFSNVLFGFNQGFLATALLGFSVAGTTVGVIADWHLWLGIASAALLFVSSSASPYNARGNNRTSIIGLVGWLGWAAWIVSYGIVLLLS